MDRCTWRGIAEHLCGISALASAPCAAVRRHPPSPCCRCARHRRHTAIFSMLNAIAWRPLQVANPDALVQLQALEPGTGKKPAFQLPFFGDFANSGRSLRVSRSTVRTASRDASAIARTA